MARLNKKSKSAKSNDKGGWQPHVPVVETSGPKIFSHHVDVPEATPEQAKARGAAMVVVDHNSRTAIELRRDGKDVVYIPQAIEGFTVEHLSAESFDRRFKPILDYPTGRAAKLFVGYATNLGGTSEAMAELSKLVHVTDEERDMATGKQTAKPANIKATTPKNKPAPTRAAAQAPTKTAPVKAAAAPKEKKEGKPSAASRFRELIMQGKLTDEDIFLTVQKELGIEDKCRSHVSWYRNNLRKKGENPPDPVKATVKKTKAA